MKNNEYQFTAKIWLYPGENANWHFVTLPKAIGQEIKQKHSSSAKGFGSLPVTVTTGKTIWETSIFPDKYSGSYLLPLKAAVRHAEDIFVDEVISLQLRLR